MGTNLKKIMTQSCLNPQESLIFAAQHSLLTHLTHLTHPTHLFPYRGAFKKSGFVI
jgi:hypothetical protein